LIKKKDEEKSKKPETLGQPEILTAIPAGHLYSVSQIRTCLLLVLQAATSLRGAPRALEIVFNALEIPYPIPSWSSVRMWVLRVGYHKLSRPKEIADDWVWIVDHTIQIGNEKCLLIVGLRLCNLPEVGTCLRHEDVEPLALFPVTQSNGDVVFQQFEKTVQKTGVPREIVSDRGSDLNAGTKKFIKAHPETCSVYDIKHKAARILKRELEQDDAWVEFVRLAAQTRTRLLQTALAPLIPPSQRAKARYMNVGSLIQWAGKLLAVMEQPAGAELQGFVIKEVEEKFDWLASYRNDISRWKSLLDVVITTESFVRETGHYTDSYIELESTLGDLKNKTPQSEKVATELITFTKEQSSQARPNERLLGSSEELESLLGGLKRLERDQSKSGITGLVLAAPAMVSKTTPEVVHEAMKTVPVKKVLEWCKNELGDTVQAIRRAVFVPVKTEQN